MIPLGIVALAQKPTGQCNHEITLQLLGLFSLAFDTLGSLLYNTYTQTQKELKCLTQLQKPALHLIKN